MRKTEKILIVVIYIFIIIGIITGLAYSITWKDTYPQSGDKYQDASKIFWVNSFMYEFTPDPHQLSNLYREMGDTGDQFFYVDNEDFSYMPPHMKSNLIGNCIEDTKRFLRMYKSASIKHEMTAFTSSDGQYIITASGGICKWRYAHPANHAPETHSTFHLYCFENQGCMEYDPKIIDQDQDGVPDYWDIEKFDASKQDKILTVDTPLSNSTGGYDYQKKYEIDPEATYKFVERKYDDQGQLVYAKALNRTTGRYTYFGDWRQRNQPGITIRDMDIKSDYGEVLGENIKAILGHDIEGQPQEAIEITEAFQATEMGEMYDEGQFLDGDLGKIGENLSNLGGISHQGNYTMQEILDEMIRQGANEEGQGGGGEGGDFWEVPEEVQAGLEEIENEYGLPGSGQYPDLTQSNFDGTFDPGQGGEDFGEYKIISTVFNAILQNNPINDIIYGAGVTASGSCSMSFTSTWGTHDLTVCGYESQLSFFGQILLAMTTISGIVMVVRG